MKGTLLSDIAMFPAHLRFCNGIYRIMREYVREQQLTLSQNSWLDGAPLKTHRSRLHLHVEMEPSSMDQLSQDSFSPAVLQQQQRLQPRLALAAPGAPGRSL